MDPLMAKKIAIIQESNRRHLAMARNARLTDILGPNDRQNLIVRGLRGLGDNINQHAFLRELDFPFYLDTPWPELYSDIPNARFIKCETVLRTQTKNLNRQSENRFVEAPQKDTVELRVSYGSRDLQVGSMYMKLSKIFGGIKPKSFGIPKFPFFYTDFYMPIAVVRPVTVRREWAAISRNPVSKIYL